MRLEEKNVFLKVGPRRHETGENRITNCEQKGEHRNKGSLFLLCYLINLFSSVGQPSLLISP